MTVAEKATHCPHFHEQVVGETADDYSGSIAEALRWEEFRVDAPFIQNSLNRANQETPRLRLVEAPAPQPDPSPAVGALAVRNAA